MRNSKEQSASFIQLILENENINSTQLAKELEVNKTFISNVKKGRSALPDDKYNRIIDLHPSFIKYADKEFAAEMNGTAMPRIVKAIKRENSFLTKDFIRQSDVKNEVYNIDKNIIAANYPCDFAKSKFEIVTIANSSLEPKFSHNDNILIDVSVKSFTHGFIFAFIHETNLYVNEITAIGNNKFKSTDINDKSFSFLLEPNSNTEIIGLVVPKFRF